MKHTPAKRAFTLIELLTVIAIIAILAGIVIPVSGSVQRSAKRAQSKAYFSSLLTAMSLYEQDYGYFPTFGVSTSGDDGTINLESAGTAVYEGLTGRNFSSGARSTAYNPRARSYFSFSDNQLDDSGNIVDSFGNTDIHLVYDRNGDGRISGGSVPSTLQTNDGQSVSISAPSNINSSAVMVSAGGGPGFPVTTW